MTEERSEIAKRLRAEHVTTKTTVGQMEDAIDKMDLEQVLEFVGSFRGNLEDNPGLRNVFSYALGYAKAEAKRVQS